MPTRNKDCLNRIHTIYSIFYNTFCAQRSHFGLYSVSHMARIDWFSMSSIEILRTKKRKYT